MPLPIPLCGNIPLFGNSVCILPISLERIGVFKLSLEDRIQIPVQEF